MDIKTHSSNTSEGENVLKLGRIRNKGSLPLVPLSFFCAVVRHHAASPPGSSSGSPSRWPRFHCSNPSPWMFIQPAHKSLADICSDCICWTISAYSFSPKQVSSKTLQKVQTNSSTGAPALNSPELSGSNYLLLLIMETGADQREGGREWHLE